MILPIVFAIWFGIVGYKAKRSWLIYAVAGAVMHMVIAGIVSFTIRSQMNSSISLNEATQFYFISISIAFVISLFVGSMLINFMLDSTLTSEYKEQLFNELKNKKAEKFSDDDCINYMLSIGIRKESANKLMGEMKD